MGFYITTPIYYVNATPHIGHAYTTIAADIIARHRRQRGEDTFFLTGTDEHGSNIPRVAEEEGLDLQEFVDRNAAAFREMTLKVNASNDFFIRTTDPRHGERVQEFLQQIYERGDIYEGVYSGLYCSRCETFYTEAELVDGLCPQHGIPPEFVEEKNYFFRLSAYAEPLLRLFDERPDIVLPGFRYNEARKFVEQGLDDISVSRASQRWGVPVPWDTNQVVYVWVDALINYWSALAFAREGEDLRPRYWPEVRHLLAKDILKFHCVIWPALLLAAGLEVPEAAVRPRLPAHGRPQDVQVGRKRHRPARASSTCTASTRCASTCSAWPRSGRTGASRSTGLHERYERELGNDLGNLLSRTTAMIARYREGRIREVAVSAEPHGGHRPRSAGKSPRDWTCSTSRARSRSCGSWFGVSTATSSSPRRGSSPRTRRAPRTSTECSSSSPTASALSRSPLPRSCPRRPSASCPRWDSRGCRVGARRRPVRTLASEGIEPAPPLFPRVDPPTAAAA